MTKDKETLASPLSEAEPTSLDELFLRMDKHIAERTLTSPQARQDRAAIVAVLRAQRAAWAKAEANGAKRAPKSKAGQTTLADLGLD